MDSTIAIREFITTTFLKNNPSKIIPDDRSLIESGIVDSLGIVKMLDFIERHFGFKVPEQDVVPEYFDSIRTIASYIERRPAGAGHR
jgi:acyl carrier protein